MKRSSNTIIMRVPPELSVRAKNEGMSTSAYTKKLLSEYDLMKEMFKTINSSSGSEGKKRGKNKGFFGGLQI